MIFNLLKRRPRNQDNNYQRPRIRGFVEEGLQEPRVSTVYRLKARMPTVTIKLTMVGKHLAALPHLPHLRTLRKRRKVQVKRRKVEEHKKRKTVIDGDRQAQYHQRRLQVLPLTEEEARIVTLRLPLKSNVWTKRGQGQKRSRWQIRWPVLENSRRPAVRCLLSWTQRRPRRR